MKEAYVWILTGAPPLSLDPTTLQNVLDDTVNVTKDVFAMLWSMSDFDVLALSLGRVVREARRELEKNKLAQNGRERLDRSHVPGVGSAWGKG